MVKLATSGALAAIALAAIALAAMLTPFSPTTRAQDADEATRLRRQNELLKKENEQLEKQIKQLEKQLELLKLDGTWVVDSATRDGKPVEDMKAGRMVFSWDNSGDKLTLKGADGKEQRVAYTIDPFQKPKVIDFTPEKNEKNAALGKAIYDVDDDTLKVCLGPPDKRPTAFTDKGQTLIRLKRLNLPLRILTPLNPGIV